MEIVIFLKSDIGNTQGTDWRRFQATQQSTDQQGQGKQQMGLSICSCSNGGVANAILRWIVGISMLRFVVPVF